MSTSSANWIWVGIIVVVVLGIAWLVDAKWFNKARYAFSNDTDIERVMVSDKPHDCDFMKAPLGEKNCHFVKVPVKVIWATSATGSNPIRSMDGGKTWAFHSPGKCDFDQTLSCPNAFDPPDNLVPKTPTVTGVMVTWEKVQD